MQNKLIVIGGPTATGKTDLGISLAKKFNGEIISADSRQVYKGMDVITGKDLEENLEFRIKNYELGITNNNFSVGFRFKDDIPVWLVDIVEPDYPFNAGEYAVLAQKVIADIWMRNKLPIIVGGTGFYIRSVINPFDTYMIPPDKLLRNQLEKLDLDELQKKLIAEDLARWDGMNDSDRKNPRRLVRAIEVAKWKEKFSQKFSGIKSIPQENILFIGLRTDFRNILRERIYKRIEKRVKQGAIEEVKKLMEKKYSWFLPAFTTTGASEIKKYLEYKQTLDEAVKSWKFQEIGYAKDQIVWFRKAIRLSEGRWFDVSEKEFQGKVEETVAKWYTRS